MVLLSPRQKAIMSRAACGPAPAGADLGPPLRSQSPLLPRAARAARGGDGRARDSSRLHDIGGAPPLHRRSQRGVCPLQVGDLGPGPSRFLPNASPGLLTFLLGVRPGLGTFLLEAPLEVLRVPVAVVNDSLFHLRKLIVQFLPETGRHETG